MSERKVLVMSTIVGAVGVLTGMVIGEVRPAFAQRIDPAYSAGTFQISAGNQNEAWRVNTSTGETYHCLSGQAGLTCRRAEIK
jgi:uncharacterized cupin superfamily protein